MVERYQKNEEELWDEYENIPDKTCDEAKAVLTEIERVHKLRVNERGADLDDTRENIKYSDNLEKAANEKRRARLDFTRGLITVGSGVTLTILGWRYQDKFGPWLDKALDRAASALRFGK